MTEYSAIVVVQTNEADQPTNLLALSEGDTISSGVLPDSVRQAVSGVSEVSSTVYDNSSSWGLGLDAGTRADIESVSATVLNTSGDLVEASVGFRVFSGDIQASTSYVSSYATDVSTYIEDNRASWGLGLDAGTRADIESVSATVLNTSGDLVEASVGFRVFSGDIQASTTYLSGYTDDLETSARNLSGLVDSSTAILDGSVVALNASSDRLFVFSGDVETSTATLDGSVVALNASSDRLFVFSGDVETSTATLDSRADAIDLSTNTYWNKTYEDVNTSSNIWNLTYQGVNSSAHPIWNATAVGVATSANAYWNSNYEDVQANRDAWAVTSGIASGFGFVPNAPTKTLSSVAISGFGDGDTSGVTIFDGAIPVYSEELGRFNYLPYIAKPAGGFVAVGENEPPGKITITVDGGFQFTNDSGTPQLLIDTQDGFLSGTGTFDISSIRSVKAGTGDFTTASAETQVVESELKVRGAAFSQLDRGYKATSTDRFAVNGSGIGTGAGDIYVVNGGAPFIYYETSTNGTVRNGSNELGLGATPMYTISSTPDSYLSGTIDAFYDNSAYARTVVSSTGVYEIQAMMNISSLGEIDVVFGVQIDGVDIAQTGDTIVGISAPHYMLSKLQFVKFLNVGQEIKVTLTAAAQHIIAKGSNLLIRRIG